MRLPAVKFKTDRIAEQFAAGEFFLIGDDLASRAADSSNARRIPIHQDVYVLIHAVNLWHWIATGEPAEITELGRSRNETRKAYGIPPELFGTKKDAPGSPHEWGRSVDFGIWELVSYAYPSGRPEERTITCNGENPRKLERYLNSRFKYVGGRFRTAKYHDVAGPHLHAQVSPHATQYLPQPKGD